MGSDIEGEWKLEGETIGSITGSLLIWSDGRETLLSRQGDDIIMELDGEQYIGNAGLAEGEIHWSDGDVWQKEAQPAHLAANAGKIILPVMGELGTDLQSLKTPSECKE